MIVPVLVLVPVLHLLLLFCLILFMDWTVKTHFSLGFMSSSSQLTASAAV